MFELFNCAHYSALIYKAFGGQIKFKELFCLWKDGVKLPSQVPYFLIKSEILTEFFFHYEGLNDHAKNCLSSVMVKLFGTINNFQQHFDRYLMLYKSPSILLIYDKDVLQGFYTGLRQLSDDEQSRINKLLFRGNKNIIQDILYYVELNEAQKRDFYNDMLVHEAYDIVFIFYCLMAIIDSKDKVITGVNCLVDLQYIQFKSEESNIPQVRIGKNFVSYISSHGGIYDDLRIIVIKILSASTAKISALDMAIEYCEMLFDNALWEVVHVSPLRDKKLMNKKEFVDSSVHSPIKSRVIKPCLDLGKILRKVASKVEVSDFLDCFTSVNNRSVCNASDALTNEECQCTEFCAQQQKSDAIHEYSGSGFNRNEMVSDHSYCNTLELPENIDVTLLSQENPYTLCSTCRLFYEYSGTVTKYSFKEGGNASPTAIFYTLNELWILMEENNNAMCNICSKLYILHKDTDSVMSKDNALPPKTIGNSTDKVPSKLSDTFCSSMSCGYQH